MSEQQPLRENRCGCVDPVNPVIEIGPRKSACHLNAPQPDVCWLTSRSVEVRPSTRARFDGRLAEQQSVGRSLRRRPYFNAYAADRGSALLINTQIPGAYSCRESIRPRPNPPVQVP
jgi:hypothetical protein